MINLAIPSVAVLLNFVLNILLDWKNGSLNGNVARQLTSTLAMYIAAIGALEIASVYQPAIAVWVLPAASVFAASEAYSALATLVKGTESKSLALAAKAAQQIIAATAATAATAETAAATQNSTNGADPFGAAKG